VQRGAQDFVAKVEVSGNNLTRAIRYAIEREKLEQEFRKLNDELERRIQDRTAQLEAANRDLEAFSSSVSHDLRAPLTRIHGFASILLEKCETQLDEAGQKYIHKIKDSALRMSALIDDLLILARVSRQGLQFHHVSLSALIDEVLREFETDTRERQIEWRIAPLPQVECDRGLMRQALINLISNAVKYTRQQKRPVIEIGQITLDEQRTFFIRDNGVGFDMEQLHKLFAPFQRLHAEQEFEGTGVGLATVERIVQKHGGRIWAESHPASGATFYFTVGSELHRQSVESAVSAAFH